MKSFVWECWQAWCALALPVPDIPGGDLGSGGTSWLCRAPPADGDDGTEPEGRLGFTVPVGSRHLSYISLHHWEPQTGLRGKSNLGVMGRGKTEAARPAEEETVGHRCRWKAEATYRGCVYSYFLPLWLNCNVF